MELNTIQNKSNWGKATESINTNFAHVGSEIDKLKYAAYNSKLYPSLEVLQQEKPNPSVGDWAIVGNTIPGAIYRCSTEGVWSATGETGGGYGMNVTETNVTENNHYGDIINNPDDEDLTEETNENEEKVMKLADKEYNAAGFSGLGRVYLRKNVSASKNILTSEMMNKENTWYIIQYDYDLNGNTINIPNGCVLNFQGGSFKNGTITGNNTKIYAPLYKIFGDNLSIKGNFDIDNSYPEWFGAKKNDTSIDNGEYINKAFTLGYNVQLGSGTYWISNPIVMKSVYHLHGRGNYNTVVKKNTTNEYNTKNCIVYIDKGSSSFAYNVDIRDVQLYNSNYSVTYAIYSSGIAMSNFSNVLCRGCKYGIYGGTSETWNINFYNVQCNSETLHNENSDYGWPSGTSYGFYFTPTITGTTLSFDKCWARGCAMGYYLRNISYSTMNSCAADNITGQSYYLWDCSLTLNGCGTEGIICDKSYVGILHFYNSNIVVNNFSAYSITIKENCVSSIVLVSMGKAIFNCCKFPNYNTTEGCNVQVKENGRAMFVAPISMPNNGKHGDVITEGSTYSVDYGNYLKVRNTNYGLYNYQWKNYWNTGTTSQRPTLSTTHKGFMFFDETLKRPLWWNGEKWIDGSGNEVK